MSNKWINRLVPFPSMFVFVLVAVAVYCLFVGNIYNSGMGLVGFFVGAAVSVTWYLFNVDINSDQREEVKLKDCTLVVFICAPGVITWLVFTCTFISSSEDKKIWIVDNHTTLTASVIIGVPFYANIQSVHTKSDSYGISVVAKSTDGIEVIVRSSKNMVLVADESLLLEMTREHSDVEAVLRLELDECLRNQLTSIVEQGTIEELKDQFSEDHEWLVGDKEETITMPSGALWSGTPKITELVLKLD